MKNSWLGSDYKLYKKLLWAHYPFDGFLPDMFRYTILNNQGHAKLSILFWNTNAYLLSETSSENINNISLRSWKPPSMIEYVKQHFEQ